MAMKVADIMTSEVTCLTPQSSLKDAHDITRNQGIRHLPVLDDQRRVVGVVTQKSMVAKVISLLSLYGHDALIQHEQDTNVMEIAVVDYKSVGVDDDLTEIARFFVENKHGCLIVQDDDDVLMGIVTSSDFVKLSIHLLNKLTADS